MPRQFLDRPGRDAPHRQEGVAEDMDPLCGETRPMGRLLDPSLHHALRQGLTVVLADDVRSPQVSVLVQGRSERGGHWHQACPGGLGGCEMPPPFGPPHLSLPPPKIDIGPRQCSDLSDPETRLTAKEDDQVGLPVDGRGGLDAVRSRRNRRSPDDHVTGVRPP